MTEDTNELRRLAEAATPGPWKAEKYGITGAGDRDVVSWDYALNDTDRGSEGTDKEFIAAANPTAILSLLDRLDETERRLEAVCNAATIKGAGRSVVRDRTLEEQLAAMTERAEKAERGLRILRECTVAERDRIHGDAMAKLRAELARRTVERDSHCEHANQESSRASDYAESNESLRTALTNAEATIAKLREAMPSEDALKGAIASVVIVESVSRKTGNPMIEPARDWLTRLEAARKEVG